MNRNAILVVVALVLSAGAVLAQDSSGVRCVGRIALNGVTATDVLIDGTYAYVGIGSRVEIVDISNPAIPQLVAYCDAPNLVCDIAILGANLFIADDGLGLRIFDIRNRAEPNEIGNYHPWGQAWGVAADSEKSYLTTSHGELLVLGMQEPAQPELIGSCRVSATLATRIQVNGNIAYVATEEPYGLAIVSVEQPDPPIQIGSYDSTGLIWNLIQSGDLTYLSEQEGLRIIDSSDPVHPQCISYYRTSIGAHGLAVMYNTAIVVSNGLSLLDISNPLTIRETGYYHFPEYATAIAVEGIYAFVASDSMLAIYDCSEAMGVRPAGTPVLPKTFLLSPAFPNPFNSRTTVAFTLPHPGEVSFGLFDPLGRQVRRLVSSGWFPAGSHQLTLNADGLPSGDYLLRVHSGENVLQQRVVLVK